MKNNIITLILVIIVGMMAYWYLTKDDSSAGYLATDVKVTNSTDATYIYNMLQEMAKVTLDDSVFSNTVFQNLKDNSVSFSPQASGRNNPFAPIGGDSNIPSQKVSSTSSKAK